MNQEWYIDTQNKILAIGKQIRGLELDLFIGILSSVEPDVSLRDPTLYRAVMGNLMNLKKTAEALRDAQQKLPTIEEVIKGCAEADAYKEAKKEQEII